MARPRSFGRQYRRDFVVLVALGVAAVVWTSSARAGLTSEVQGFAALYESHARETCGGLVDLVAEPHHRRLSLVTEGPGVATERPGVVRIRALDDGAGGADGMSPCAATGWAVSATSGTGTECAAALCDVVATHPPLARALDSALVRAGPGYPREETAVPSERSAMHVDAWSVAWLAVCLFALFGGIALSLSGREGTARARWWAVVVVLTGVGFGLRAWLALKLPIADDELSSWGLTSLWQELGNPDLRVNPPLYRILAWPVATFSEGSASAGRWVAVALGTATIPVVAATGRNLATKRAGWIAATLTAVHPGLAAVGAFHRSYAALVLFAALATWAAEVATRQGGARARYATACFAVCTVLSHWFGAFYVAGLVLWIAAAARARKGAGLREWHGPAELSVLLLLPFVPLALGGTSDKVRAASDVVGTQHFSEVGLSLLPVLTGQWSPELQGSIGPRSPIVALVGGGVIALVAIVWMSWRCKASKRAARLWIVAAAAAVPPLLATLRVSGIREIQMLSAAVPLVLLAGVYLGDAGGGRRRSAVSVFVAGLLVIGGATVTVARATRQGFVDPTAPLVEYVGAHPEARPLHVWEWDDFYRAGVRLGVSPTAVFASTDGRDEVLRPLRSCATAAVREAAGHLEHGTPVWIAIMPDTHEWRPEDPPHSRCDAARLDGDFARCDEVQDLADGGVIVRCDVSRSATVYVRDALE